MEKIIKNLFKRKIENNTTISSEDEVFDPFIIKEELIGEEEAIKLKKLIKEGFKNESHKKN